MSPSKSTPVGTRVVYSAGLGSFWASGYFALGRWGQTAHTLDPSITVDSLIPFLGWAVWPYIFGILWIALPAALIRSADYFTQIAATFALNIGMSFLCFLIVPTQTRLREQASTTDLDFLTAWAVNTLYSIDPPTNLLPSLHVSLAVIATVAIGRQHPEWKAALLIVLAAIILSVLILKQHTIIDALAGIIVACIAFSLSGCFRANQRALT